MLGYSLTGVGDLGAKGWDGIVVVGNQDLVKKLPDSLTTSISAASMLDESFHSGVTVLSVSLNAKRLIYSGLGKLNPDYHDVRSFSEAAVKGMKRALKAGVKNPIIVLVAYEGFTQARLVTLLGAMEALYTPLQYKEHHSESHQKVMKLGIWCNESINIDNLIKVATALECGRVAARDIGGSDPERMAPPKVEEYVAAMFPPSSNVSLEIIKDDSILSKEYPLFSAVNRAAKQVERHKGRIIYLKYEGSAPKETLLIVGKGVTYDTGGADLKVAGVMAGMSRDKCGAAAVAGFIKTVSLLGPANLRVVGAMGLVRNSIGEDCYVADEIIKSRSGKLVRIGNTDAEGRMIMADILAYMKNLALTYDISHLMTIATLTGHAYLTVGPGYSIVMDNGPARRAEFAQKVQYAGQRVGDMFEISNIRREDFAFNEGKNEGEDLVQANNQPSSRTPRGHQVPAAFLISVSGLDKHGLGSEHPLKYSHIDIAGSAGDVPDIATGAPILALSSHFLNISY